ncbi:MAG: hypothetical protein GXP43_02620, partial [bacterium]|nr:hypothetical protein [bacterium]
MPIRKTIFETDNYYHLISRITWKTPIFKDSLNASFMKEVLTYYALNQPPLKFSLYRRLKDKDNVKLNFNNRLVTILAFCIMPTHIHLLIRQEKDNGIRVFMHKSLTSFSRYFNIKNKNHGGVFEGRFKAALVESDEYLTHLSRYIHLNPVTARIVENPEDYQFSSYTFYLE